MWNQLVGRPNPGSSSGGGQVLVIPWNCSSSGGGSTFSLFFAENLLLSVESDGKAGPTSGVEPSHLDQPAGAQLPLSPSGKSNLL